MRFINTKTQELRSFYGEIPVYAILSHTWGRGEITFEQMRSLEKQTLEQLPGWKKIKSACYVANHDGWEYIWIDTCCIDKNNSAELSECINSMFKYYAEAGTCYAYLSDVHIQSLPPSPLPCDEFVMSRWFRRSWTLQELLAPTLVVFLNENWQSLGSRDVHIDLVQKATGISLGDFETFSNCTIGTMLSWAANREATRTEDTSYSLLGLLRIQMPMLYGEGWDAFRRLQHEILKSSNDETILAWSADGIRNIEKYESIEFGVPLLAPRPSLFNEEMLEYAVSNRRPFTMTNAGLSISGTLWKPKPYAATTSYAFPLNCKLAKWSSQENMQLALPLEKLPETSNIYRRHYGKSLLEWPASGRHDYENLGQQTIIISESPPSIRRSKELLLAFGPLREAVPRYFIEWNIEKQGNSGTIHAPLIPEWSPVDEPETLVLVLFSGLCAVIAFETRADYGTAFFGVSVYPRQRIPLFGITEWDSIKDRDGLEKNVHMFNKDIESWPQSVISKTLNKRIAINIAPYATSKNQRWLRKECRGRRLELSMGNIEVVRQQGFLRIEI